ncbi:AAA family ATPase [Botrimarina hoheduenensis]|uniref:Stage V sporulation protein K n=1 Tax=Botrimarina hoheduenensis TaxID=2528000 RepID=A0A5C5WFD5_9BACT|nr:AAA family ATPase [Botrimarina hoheduenensis]TWT48789.1 Stage V sporulation protein K [Botrimarina hoheduenensis]
MSRVNETFSALANHHSPASTPRYADLLTATRQLFCAAAQRIEKHHAGLVENPARFVRLMEDLHSGVLLKVYFTICEADRKWSSAERELATDLAEHLWAQRLPTKRLVEVMREAAQRSQLLQWESLLGPFRRLPPLADDIPMLETLVIRQSNLLARCDGPPAEIELAAIRDLAHRVRVAIDPSADRIPLEEEAEPMLRSTAPTPARSLSTATNSAPDTAPARRTLDEVLAQIDSLVGLEGVKAEVRSLANYLSLQKRRQHAGLPATSITLHMVFVGNPGTGKTTVARLVGEALAALEVLPTGQLVETDRGGLIAEYAGQTASKVNQRVDEALGGVLFIDEAYGIVSHDGSDVYGAEAIQTLLKRAEDDRDKLAIVLAGYPQPMDRLLASNPGLESRFSRRFAFADYTPPQLCAIFGRLLTVHHYEITPVARLRVIHTLTKRYAERDEHFGNGREVRNLFERAVMRMADRLAQLATLDEQQLITFEADDIGPGDGDGHTGHQETDEGDTDAVTPALSDANPVVRLHVGCPGCGHAAWIPFTQLGSTLSCPKCPTRFVAEWGDLADPG